MIAIVGKLGVAHLLLENAGPVVSLVVDRDHDGLIGLHNDSVGDGRDHVTAILASALEIISMPDHHWRPFAVQRHPGQRTVEGRGDREQGGQSFGDPVRIGVFLLPLVGLVERHIARAIEIRDADADGQRDHLGRPLEFAMEGHIGDEQIGGLAFCQLVALVAVNALCRFREERRTVILRDVAAHLRIEVDEDHAPVRRRLFEGAVELRDQAGNCTRVRGAIGIGPAEHSRDAAHLRFDPEFLAARFGHRCKFAVLFSLVGLIFERQLKTCRNEGAGNEDLVVGSLEIAGILQTRDQTILQLDIMVEQIKPVGKTKIAGEDADNIGARRDAGLHHPFALKMA